MGTSSYVDILKNGKEVEQSITLGATASDETQVVSGLKSGQEVVLVSLSAKVPSSTGSSTGGGLTGGGLGGGGGLTGGGGGFTGGGGGGGRR